MFERGKVVLVPFPFTDLSSQKIRPALILSKNNRTNPDIVVLFISSVIVNKSDEYSYIIQTDHKAFSQTGLKVTAVVVCHKLATLDKSIVIGEVGEFPVSLMKEISQRVSLALGL